MTKSKNHCNTEGSILLSGSGRSGTTWLSNIIAANPNVRVFFEPFDYRRVPAAACQPLLAYARTEGSYPARAQFMKAVLCGSVENEWINQQGRRRWTNRRVIKSIRVNMMLGWIDRLFHPRIVYILRHPCAVILSRLKLAWEPHVDVLLSQPDLVEDFLEPFLGVIARAKSSVEQQAVSWCVENLVPLQQLSSYNWIFCTYEQLYRNPDHEVARILNALQIRKTWLTTRAIRRVSSVTRHDSALQTHRTPLTEWQEELTSEDIKSILDIVAAFGIELYGSGPMPQSNPDGISAYDRLLLTSSEV